MVHRNLLKFNVFDSNRNKITRELTDNRSSVIREACITPDGSRNPPPSAQNLPNSRGGFPGSPDLDQIFWRFWTISAPIYAPKTQNFRAPTARFQPLYSAEIQNFRAPSARFQPLQSAQNPKKSLALSARFICIVYKEHFAPQARKFWGFRGQTSTIFLYKSSKTTPNSQNFLAAEGGRSPKSTISGNLRYLRI